MRGARLVRLFLDCVAFQGHTETVRALLEAGADRTLKFTEGPYEGKTALDCARDEATKELLRSWGRPVVKSAAHAD